MPLEKDQGDGKNSKDWIIRSQVSISTFKKSGAKASHFMLGNR